jgi:hypothetical protein
LLDRTLKEIPSIKPLLVEVSKGLFSALKTSEQTTKEIESLCSELQYREPK